MTDQRHPSKPGSMAAKGKRIGDGFFVSAAIPVPSPDDPHAVVPGEPVWTTTRTLDSVRAAALTAAIDFLRSWEPADAEEDAIATILAVAAWFEAWLLGTPSKEE